MEISHTPEPWSQVKRGALIQIVNSKGLVIAELINANKHEVHLDAARIVTCVNACKGFAFPELQVQQLKTGNSLLELERIKLTEQRDELLAALKQIANTSIYAPMSMRAQARNAIAKTQTTIPENPTLKRNGPRERTVVKQDESHTSTRTR